MEILENKKNLDVFLSNIREKSHKIGLIPTMGSIHKGHLSLVEKSKNINCFSLATIFINPTQFNDPKDFDQYPQNRDLDIAQLKYDGPVDILPGLVSIYFMDPNGVRLEACCQPSKGDSPQVIGSVLQTKLRKPMPLSLR